MTLKEFAKIADHDAWFNEIDRIVRGIEPTFIFDHFYETDAARLEAIDRELVRLGLEWKRKDFQEALIGRYLSGCDDEGEGEYEQNVLLTAIADIRPRWGAMDRMYIAFSKRMSRKWTNDHIAQLTLRALARLPRGRIVDDIPALLQSMVPEMNAAFFREALDYVLKAGWSAFSNFMDSYICHQARIIEKGPNEMKAFDEALAEQLEVFSMDQGSMLKMLHYWTRYADPTPTVLNLQSRLGEVLLSSDYFRDNLLRNDRYARALIAYLVGKTRAPLPASWMSELVEDGEMQEHFGHVLLAISKFHEYDYNMQMVRLRVPDEKSQAMRYAKEYDEMALNGCIDWRISALEHIPIAEMLYGKLSKGTEGEQLAFDVLNEEPARADG